MTNNSLHGRQFGKYTVVEVLGKGGMATVYRAHDSVLDRDVAFKVFDLTSVAVVGEGTSEDFRARFQREARTAAKLDHPHIVKIFDFGVHDDQLYMAMQLLPGGNLEGKQRSLSLVEISQILDQICSALDYAHESGVIHRDLKPSNVMLDAKGNALLADFGIAKVANRQTQLTQAGMTPGTPSYMSPEMWQGAHLTPTVDIYALGIMIFEMLTGDVPFKADTLYHLMYKHVSEPPPLLRDLSPQFERFDPVIQRALAKNPADRYPSAGELAEAFAQVLQSMPETAVTQPMRRTPLTGASVVSKPPTGGGIAAPVPPTASAKRTGPRLEVILLLVAILLILAVGILVILTQTRGPSTPATTVPAVLNLPSATVTTTPSSTPSPSATSTPTATYTPSHTPSATATPSHTPTFTPTITSSATGTHTATPTPSSTWTASYTLTITPSHTATPSLTPSITPSPTITLTPSITPSPTATNTPSITPTFTPNAVAMQSFILEPNTNVEGTIKSEGGQWRQAWTLQDRKVGDELEIQIVVLGAGESLMPSVRLVGPDGQVVAGDDDIGRQGALTARLPLPGNYQIEVSRRNREQGNSEGRYALFYRIIAEGQLPSATPVPTLTPSPTAPATLTPTWTPAPGDIDFGGTVVGYLSTDQTVNEWRFDAQAKDQISVQVAGASGSTLSLRGPDGASQDIAPNTPVTLAAAGRYTLLITGRAGGYQLSLNRAQATLAQTTAPITVCDGVRHALFENKGMNTDVPNLKQTFIGLKGQQITAFTSAKDPRINTVLELLDSSGASITKNDDDARDVGLMARIENFTLPRSDLYTLNVQWVESSSGGEVSLYLLCNRPMVPPLAELPPLPILNSTTILPINQAITLTGGSGSYAFLGRRGDVMRLQARSYGGVIPVFTVNSRVGSVYSTLGTSGTQFDRTFGLPYTGVYNLSVAGLAVNTKVRFLLRPEPFPVQTLISGQALPAITVDDRPPQPRLWHTFRFDANAGDAVSLTVSNVQGTLIPLLMVFAPNGRLVAYSGPNDSTDPHKIVLGGLQLQVSGEYQVVVARAAGDRGTTEGTFTLAYQVLDKVPAQRWVNPTALAYNSPVAGEFGPAGSQNWTLNGTKGDLVSVEMDRSYGEGQPAIQSLKAADGQPVTPLSIALAEDGYVRQIYHLPETGVYTLTVSGSALQYGLVAMLNRNIELPPTTLFANTVTKWQGVLLPKTRISFKVPLQLGDRINSWLVFWGTEATRAGVGQDMKVYWGEGNSPAEMPYRDTAITSVSINNITPTRPTIYTLALENNSDSIVAYTLNEVDGTHAAPTPTPVAFPLFKGEVHTGRTEGGDSVFRLLGFVGERFQVTVETGTNTTPRVTVVGPKGDTLAPKDLQDRQGYIQFTFEPTLSGDQVIYVNSDVPTNYRLTVRAWDKNGQPDLAAKATLIPSQNAEPIAYNVPAQLTLKAGETRRFVFDGQAGQTVHVGLYTPPQVLTPTPTPKAGSKPVISGFYASVRLYDPSGTLVQESSTGDAQLLGKLIVASLSQSGRYTIEIQSRGSADATGQLFVTVASNKAFPADATLLTATPLQGNLGGSALIYRMQSTSTLVVLRPKDLSSPLQAHLDIYTLDGLLVGSVTASKAGDEVRALVLNSGGTGYAVVVTGANNSTGEFVIYSTESRYGSAPFQCTNKPQNDIFYEKVGAPLGVVCDDFARYYEAYARTQDKAWVKTWIIANNKAQYRWIRVKDITFLSPDDLDTLPIEAGN